MFGVMQQAGAGCTMGGPPCTTDGLVMQLSTSRQLQHPASCAALHTALQRNARAALEVCVCRSQQQHDVNMAIRGEQQREEAGAVVQC